MAIFVISISLDSSEESVGAFTILVILFGTIPTTIPSIVPTVDSPTIPHIAPTIQYTSSFVCTDSSNSDTLGTPPSQDPYEVTVARWRSRVVARSSPLLSPIQDSPPTHDSSQESSSDSSSKSSLEFHSDTSPDSSLRHSSSVPVASSIPRALSYVRFDLFPPRKRIKDYDFVTDFDVSSKEGYVSYVPKQIGLAVDVRDSYEPYTEPDIDPDVKEDIDACIVFTDDIADRGTYAKRPTEPVREDYPDLVCIVGSLEVMQREDQGHRIVVTSQQSAAMSEMISTLERDNMRLRGMLAVKRQRFDCVQHNAINELIAKCVAEALEAYGAARNPVTETEMENEQQDEKVEANVNNGNGNGNGNGNPNVMDAPTLSVSAEKNLGDPIEIRVDIVHPTPTDVFPAATVVRTLAQHGEAIRGIHGHLQGVPINEEMNALRFRIGMAEEENASLCGRIKTIEAIDTVTRRQEKKALIELEQQLASVQESQRQDQENFRKLQEFVTNQLGRHS
nr:hypothetical protein [Tanacetum cinerariifolium]